MADAPATETPRLDLTPQAAPRRGRRWLPLAVFVVVLVVAAVVLVRAIGSASLFFYNVDEAVERRAELGDDRFRMQGTPFGNPVETELENQRVVVFNIRFDGVSADVVHTGDPPEMFAPGVPVVLEGRWVQGQPPATTGEGAADGWYFASDGMLVKHDNDYRTDRLVEAEEGGEVPAAEGSAGSGR